MKKLLKAKASLFLCLQFRVRSAVYERRKSLLLLGTVCVARSKTHFKVFINVLRVRKPAKIFKRLRFPRRHFCILLLLQTKVWRSVRRSAHLLFLGLLPKPALLLESKQIAAKSIFICIVRQFRNSKNIIKTSKVFFSNIRNCIYPHNTAFINML